jgi:hypothetical protein
VIRLENLQVVLIAASNPSSETSRAKMKSIQMVWKGAGGNEIGSRDPYGKWRRVPITLQSG